MKIKKNFTLFILILAILSACSSEETSVDEKDFATFYQKIVISFVNQLDDFYVNQVNIDQNFLSHWNDFYNPVEKIILIDGKEFEIESMVVKDFSLLMNLSQMVGTFADYENTYTYVESSEKVIKGLHLDNVDVLNYSEQEISNVENSLVSYKIQPSLQKDGLSIFAILENAYGEKRELTTEENSTVTSFFNKYDHETYTENGKEYVYNSDEKALISWFKFMSTSTAPPYDGNFYVGPRSEVAAILEIETSDLSDWGH